MPYFRPWNIKEALQEKFRVTFLSSFVCFAVMNSVIIRFVKHCKLSDRSKEEICCWYCFVALSDARNQISDDGESKDSQKLASRDGTYKHLIEFLFRDKAISPRIPDSRTVIGADFFCQERIKKRHTRSGH